jgi:hypothetical protein
MLVARHTSRRIRRLGRQEVKHRLAKHLCDVASAQQGPGGVFAVYIKECNSSSPPNLPIRSALLFGEEGYFLDNKTCADPPPDGWRLVVHF